ncbi:hypothetical protein RHOSPDRAFT_16072 [Rhodotorula sp. JG-1b]|nr:hypothetical protein RHOSPDRAFT_16072 [Rhodotorula sp. JG-1b]
MAAARTAAGDPKSLANLTQLVASSSNAVAIPSPDSLTHAIAQRYRLDLTATYAGHATLVVVNPLEPKADISEASKAEYEDRTYRLRPGTGPAVDLDPHAYDLASRVYFAARRTGHAQSITYSGLSGAGASSQQHLVTAQLLRLSTSGKKDTRLAEQVSALETVLTSFGCARTASNPSATRYSSLLELHLNAHGRLAGAKVLAYGLDRTRFAKLEKGERSFHVLYQLVAGATHQERDEYALLDDPAEYVLFRKSTTFRLPAGVPLADDSIAFDELRTAFKVLGFKPRHVAAIYRVLSAILLLGNLDFAEHPEDAYEYQSEPAWVTNHEVLEQCAALLGVAAPDLERSLTNRVRWVRKEMMATILRADGADHQRDSLMAALYSIVFAFVVETANHRLFPGDDAITAIHNDGGTSIVQFSQPGFTNHSLSRPGSRTSVLVQALNGYDDFVHNYQTELARYWAIEQAFDGDAGIAARAQEDGVRVLDVLPADDGTSRIELLRGGRIGGKADRKPGGILGGLAKTCASLRKGVQPDQADSDLVAGMRDHFAAHSSFVAHPTGPGARTSFAIQHWGNQTVAYDAYRFVETDCDAFDPEQVALLRSSSDPFVNKLVSGPALAAEVHPIDDATLVAAQVSSMPLRRPSPVQATPAFTRTEGEAEDYTAPLLDPLAIYPVSTQINATTAQLLGSILARSQQWNVIALLPNATSTPRQIDARLLKAQVAAFQLPQLVARRNTADWAVDSPYEEFLERHELGASVHETARDAVANYLRDFGFDDDDGGDFALGNARVWLSWRVWKAVEDRLREQEPAEHRDLARGNVPPQAPYMYQQSGRAGGAEFPSMGSFGGYGGGGGGPGGRDSEIWGMPQGDAAAPNSAVPFTPVGARALGANKEAGVLDREGNPQEGEGKAIEEVPTSRGRRVWVALVWALTWWIPTPCLTYVGRMKRPDVRMAWREKLALCMLIGFFCGIVIFYIIVFGRLLCPNYNKAWNEKELGYHSGSDDYWVGVRGNVYDLTKFYKIQHSDIQGQPVTSTDMLTLGGLDVTHYFPIPLTSACPDLVSDQSLSLQYENFTAEVPTAVHTSGSLQPATGSALYQNDWYFDTFLPKMRKYYKGPLVWSKGKVSDEANKAGRQWAIVNGSVYDLTDYFYTYNLLNDKSYLFLNASIANVWTAQPGTDITGAIKELGIDAPTLKTNMDCIQTLFYVGETDFRDTPRCQVQPNLLLAFSILIMLTILVKFLAALQFGSKRLPEQRDKFVICQVPCYTEGEDSLKKTIDSLATLNYDDRRKLLFIICDGMIVGSGNDRPTPRIVLDILGVDQTVEPDPLMYKAVAEGSKQLNYGKVWSGLYEVEGHVVPYIVVAKVGRPSERSRPGNRGKRDSQILVMRFLNRVHFDAEMYPLELEMYHQIKNIIGVDPQFYEFMFVIDADTSVEADSLNRLVAAATDDSQIIGICGETRLENEQVSWWTMIQVYEYFISHHMAKAFESLFGSVTCLPGCFTMFRIRSADKGKPLLVSSLIIDDYSDGNLDTLHKKNLLALGEDRYLTTLILKHFPTYKTKFIADAKAQTVAPHSWGILLSQRRRWINSTVHNLAELMFLPNMCGFCCFSMRFVVFIDLLGTIILPATFVYLVYLIVTVATGSGQIPMIAIIMIAAVYGLQAIIFLLKRQWQFIGWLIIYLIAYPVYSFLLPVYSFWRFDDFTWGNTRVVVGEGRSKKVLQAEDEAFDESTIPLARFAEYEAALAEEALDMRSEKTRSEAGFSLATRMGPTYGAATTQPPYGSRASLQMPPQGFTGYGGGGGGPGSVVGSDFGYPASVHPYMPPATLQSQMSLAGYGGNGGVSAPQLPMSALPRRQSGMSAFTYGGAGGAPSVFSMNPFANPPAPTVSDDPNPSDEVLVSTLQAFLATQDLMQLSKRKAREGLAALFPRADLSSRKDWINEQIDRLLAP